MMDGEAQLADDALDPDRYPELYDGILSKRVVAFFIDAILIVVMMVPAALVVLVLGIITLGIGWLLYGALFAIVALGYYALTLGGPTSASVGMRITNIQLRTWTGGPMFPLLAVMHALIFYFSMALTPIVLVVGLFTSRRQLIQDLLLGTVAVNTPAFEAAHV